MDEDQAVTGDIIELEALEGDFDCWVMQDQPKYEWASVIVFNNAKLQHMTPEFVQDEKNALFDFSWARNVGHLPAEWNHCCGYREPRTDAKLYHYTQGIPYWPECRGLPEDKIWFEEYDAMLESVEWIDLHQNTRHFGPVMNRHLKKYGIDANFRMKDQ
jgi:hypothetical protein